MKRHLRRTIEREFTKLARPYAHLTTHQSRSETREIVAWINPRRKDWVLDAACGPGSLAQAMVPLAARVCALDLCAPMLRACREASRKSFPALFLTLGDVAQLPYRSQRFDLVTCAYSFANFPDPLQVVKELARVTRRGGRIAVIDLVAPEDSTQRDYLNRLEALRGHLFTRVLKRSEFLNIFDRAHLRLESCSLRVRRRRFRNWLRLSPALADPRRARRLRQMLLDSAEGDQAGLRPHAVPGDIIFYHTTAGFLLRRRSARKFKERPNETLKIR